MPITVGWLAAAAIAALVWLNVYVCREALWLAWSGRMNSMHGVWITLAAQSLDKWLWPTWWPYWMGGLPMENTYPPGVPVAMRWIAQVAGGGEARAFHIVAVVSYALVPVALFGLLWRLGAGSGWRRMAAAFCAAAAYSVYTPLSNRFYLTFIWDEVPHLLALGLVLLAVTALHEGWTTASTLLFAAAFLTNAFGLTGAAILAGVWTAATGDWRRAATVLVPAYLIASPWVPPSLIETMRANAAAVPERASPAGLAVALAMAATIAWFTRRRMTAGPRCLLIAGAVLSCAPWLSSLPQPDRYRLEADAVFVSALALAVAWLAFTLRPKWIPAAVGIVLLWPGAKQLIELRRFAKRELRAAVVDSNQTIEARVARWLAAHPDGGMVLAPGSIGQWMNVFAPEVRQFGGGSYPTAVNPAQQSVLIWCNTIEAAEVKKWLSEYGVTRFVVPGGNSPEFWKPVREPRRFEQEFRLLWREDDTSIYEIPRASDAPPPVNYHHGWRATVDGNPRRIVRSDWGTIAFDPPCVAPCRAQLTFDGGIEARLTRVASATALLIVLVRALSRAAAAGTARRVQSSC